MLVITRRSSDRISFPQLGITVHFIRVQGSAAKVGVDAPRDIAIVRDEVADDAEAAAKLRSQWLTLPRKVRHDIRNELHTLSIAVHLFREQQRAGLDAEANETFDQIQATLDKLGDNRVLRRPDDGETRTIAGAVLVIEDDDNERELLAGFLRLQGHAVVAFRDGQEAIDYLREHDTPSAVLVDMRMPRCDGGTVVRNIRGDARHAEAKVYAVSGSTPEENGVEIGGRGVDRWFRKPLNPQHLVEAI